MMSGLTIEQEELRDEFNRICADFVKDMLAEGERVSFMACPANDKRTYKTYEQGVFRRLPVKPPPPPKAGAARKAPPPPAPPDPEPEGRRNSG